MEAMEEHGRDGASRRLDTVMREGERVTPLELFFDLIFVVALTQCTTLMIDNPSWEGVAQGIVVLALLWWAWAAYAWLTSTVDPEEGAVRLALLAAMAALLLAALSVPSAFGDGALAFALAYGMVRFAHVALFVLVSRDDPTLRRSVARFAASSGVGLALLVCGALLGDPWQAALWGLALVLDMGAPQLRSAEGWRLVPAHFAERHGLVIIIALGESIVALGVGADVGLSLAVATAAVLGIALVFELWWTYFDLVAIANVRRLVRAPAGRERNQLARDVYTYLHFPLLAGIVLAALGLHEVLAHPEDSLDAVPAFALLGGVAIYLLGHVAVRLRGAHTLNRQRLALAIALLLLIPAALDVPALGSLGAVALLLAALLAYETRLYGERRGRVRREYAAEGATSRSSP